MALITGAEVWRNGNAVLPDDHDNTVLGASVDLVDHPQADIVGAILDHPVHGHDITTVAVVLGGGAVTDPAAPGPLESAGGGQVNTGAVDDLAAAQAHAAGAAPAVHAHGAGVPTVHTNLNSDILVAAVPTLITNGTFSLDVNTLVDDLVLLTYIEEGELAVV